MHTSKFATSASRRFALVAGVALLALASCSEDKSISGASTSSGSSVAATSTTLDATTTTTDPAATTIDPTVTTVSEAPTTVPAPAPTAAPPVAPPADDYTPLGESRLVMLPEDDNVFNVGEFTCTGGISFDYGEVEQCVEQDDLIVISYRIPEGKRVVEVYVRVETFWVETYRTIEEFDFELSAVDLYIDDFAGIGYPAAFIGYRIDGSGRYLDFDIVQLEATGLDVRGIRGIDHGNVALPAGAPGVVVAAVYADSDPNCCPTSMLHQNLAYVSGAWGVTDGTLYPTASAPGVSVAF